MKEDTIRFGDIYTNGINYWMVVAVHGNKCACSCHSYMRRHEIRPVVLDENSEPAYFVGYYEGQIKDIKPHARLFMRAEFTLPT